MSPTRIIISNKIYFPTLLFLIFSKFLLEYGGEINTTTFMFVDRHWKEDIDCDICLWDSCAVRDLWLVIEIRQTTPVYGKSAIVNMTPCSDDIQSCFGQVRCTFVNLFAQVTAWHVVISSLPQIDCLYTPMWQFVILFKR